MKTFMYRFYHWWSRKFVPLLRRGIHTGWFKFSIPLILTSIIRIIIYKVGFTPPGGVWGEIGFWIGFYLFTCFIVNLPSVIFIISLLPDMWRIDSLARPPTRSEIITFAKKSLQNLLKQTTGVLGQTGVYMDKSIVDEFTKRCFTLGAGIYNGVERHLPSEFYKRYPGYLDAHKENLIKNPDKQSVRILLATRAALREDYQKDKATYDQFHKWHHDKPNIKLLHVQPGFARDLKTSLKLPTTDIGIWTNEYALFFQPQDEPETSALLNLIPRGDSRFQDSWTYFNKLLESAKEVNNPPQLVDKNIAENWEAYVNPSRRHVKLMPVLLNLLSQYKEHDSILDAAAGIGCESVSLLDEGFNVTSNELEPNFCEAAKRYSYNHGVKLQTLDSYNWLELETHYRTRFGAVLVLGNSICLLPRDEEIRMALKQFFSVLKHGGILIIDERNFSYIYRNAEQIRINPSANFPFGKSMYRGSTVKGCPIEILESKITWACYTNGIAVNNWESLNNNIIGEFELYPFKKGELENMLVGVGFNIKARYYDLNESVEQEAEFITYVAEKP